MFLVFWATLMLSLYFNCFSCVFIYKWGVLFVKHQGQESWGYSMMRPCHFIHCKDSRNLSYLRFFEGHRPAVSVEKLSFQPSSDHRHEFQVAARKEWMVLEVEQQPLRDPFKYPENTSLVQRRRKWALSPDPSSNYSWG